jgi:Cft2 family RNA processing exonuclease
MQTGPSRELLELWAPDSRNGLIITGYSVEGTLARVSNYLLAVGILRIACCFVHNISQWALFSPSTSLHV